MAWAHIHISEQTSALIPCLLISNEFTNQIQLVKFEDLTATSMKMAVVWDATISGCYFLSSLHPYHATTIVSRLKALPPSGIGSFCGRSETKKAPRHPLIFQLSICSFNNINFIL